MAKEMYTMKPINKNFTDVPLPNCMYTMKSLHSFDQEKTIAATISCPTETGNHEIDTLAQRQYDILRNLGQLKDEVEQLAKKLNYTLGSQTSVQANEVPKKKTRKLEPPTLEEGTLDFIIASSSEAYSVSPIVLASILRSRGVNITTPAHCHSSLKAPLPGDLKKLTNGVTGSLKGGRSKAMFTYMWKNESFLPALIYKPSMYTKIYGDVNIARFLSRVFAPDLYADQPMDVVTSIDKWLDVANQMNHGSKKDQEAALKSMNQYLGKHEYLASNEATLADVVLLSSLRMKPSLSTPDAVSSWVQRVTVDFDL